MKENILSLHTPLTPGMGSKGQVFVFSESGHVAYQITSKNFYLTHTPDIWSLVERSDIEIGRASIFFIELSSKT